MLRSDCDKQMLLTNDQSWIKVYILVIVMGLVPIDPQDATSIFDADVESLLGNEFSSQTKPTALVCLVRDRLCLVRDQRFQRGSGERDLKLSAPCPL